MRDPRNAATPPSAGIPSAVSALSAAESPEHPAPQTPSAPVTPAQHAVARWAALAAQQQCCAGVPHQTARSA